MNKETGRPLKKKTDPTGPRQNGPIGETAVLENIAAMPEPYRGMGERLHSIVTSNAPSLKPRVWYGMPAYTKDGKVVCFFRGVIFSKKERYMTFGFTEEAKIDERNMWPVAYALTDLTHAEEAKIAELVRKAVGRG